MVVLASDAFGKQECLSSANTYPGLQLHITATPLSVQRCSHGLLDLHLYYN